MSFDPPIRKAEFQPDEIIEAQIAGAEAVAGTEPLDPITAAALAQLEAAPEEKTWIQSAILLAVSLAVFATTGLFNDKPANLLLLIGVLFFHELGHYAGMRLFNYQDVRMFFIPFFGAAVKGRSRSVQGYKEAIVLLLGPLPGIVIGGLLAMVSLQHHDPLLRSAALLLVVVNGFNLLPFMPLDGGRLLHLVLFSRQPYLEALFRIVTGGLLALCGWALGAWMLAGLGVWIVIGTGYTFRVSQLARLLRGPLQTGGEMDLSARIPRELAVPLIERVRHRFPQMTQSTALANTVRQVWERIHLRPPGVIATLALLALHAGGFIAALAIVIILST